MIRFFTLLSLLLAAGLLFSCQEQGQNSKPELLNPGDTPTEAYKRLYAAVKSKNTEAIKRQLSGPTQEFAKTLSAKQNAPIEKVFENGFTASTFSETLPEIRDERVKDNMGAIEVWNAKDKRWEDLPYIREKDGWKLAIGEIFGGSYRSPGKGRDMIEREAANAMKPPEFPKNGNSMPPIPKSAANANK